jgi:hypothetical protein
MTDRIDQRFDKLKELIAAYPSFASTVTTEADARLKLIDTMVLDVLGWEKADVQAEESTGRGFLDYKLY